MRWWQSWTNRTSASLEAESNTLTQEYLQHAEFITHSLRRMMVQARRIASGAMTGTVQSWIKGQGVQFAGVRAYSDADDARLIDWNTTARLQSPMVRYATEERNNDVYILIDLSPSMMASIGEIPLHTALMTALSIMCAVDYAGDMFSVLAYHTTGNTTMTLCAPLGKGEQHLTRSATCLLKEIFRVHEHYQQSLEHLSQSASTTAAHDATRRDTLHIMLQDAVVSLRKRSIVFFISDGQTSLQYDELRALALGATRKHDCVFVGIQPHNAYPHTLRAEFADAELGQYAHASWQRLYHAMAERNHATQSCLDQSGVRVVSIAEESMIESVLRTLFRRKR